MFHSAPDPANNQKATVNHTVVNVGASEKPMLESKTVRVEKPRFVS